MELGTFRNIPDIKKLPHIENKGSSHPAVDGESDIYQINFNFKSPGVNIEIYTPKHSCNVILGKILGLWT